MATLRIERIHEISEACRHEAPLSDRMLAEVCSLATPFTLWHHKMHRGNDGGDELCIYNMDTDKSANPASGARFYPRADHDTDAAIELIRKFLPEPYRVDICVMSGHDWHYAVWITKAMSVGDGRYHCTSSVLPLAILGAAMDLLAAHRTFYGPADQAQAEPADEPLPELPSDSEDPSTTFEELPA